MTDIEILPANSDKKPFQVRQAWMDKPGPVPWVQHGNVFLSLFETGEDSWPPVVRQVAGGKASLFTILTGRHGSNMQLTTAGGQFTQVKDPDHLVQDQIKVAGLSRQLPDGSDLMLLDVTDEDFNTKRRLRSIVRQLVDANRYVILAWCFSIYAFKTVSAKKIEELGDDAAGVQQYMKTQHPNLLDQSVKDIIQSDWTPL